VAAFAQRGAIPSAHDLHTQYPNAEAIILAVGRLVKEKNFASLIRAFKKVIEQHAKAQLVIIGSGPQKDALAELVERCEFSAQVAFIPWTDDVASYMRSADIFALCSYREGWGRVIVEAMAAGVAGVVTDVGCVGEVFIAERHGIVVPVDDTDALKDALGRLISDPQLRRTFGEAAALDTALSRAAQHPYAEAWRHTLEACSASE
jgi:glycosyltransferase involved in cell wall biosynthesis